MKTLKRTLCLVLAVVMVLGTLAVSASAAKFVDDAKIEYDAAVGTMAGLGIINGKGNDIFDPDGTVTRAEAAKMITVALIGEAAAKKLPASTSFKDVAASHWAAPYIAYCVRQGIINGKSATEFDPEGNVTGVELSKMLLCALGYGKLNEYVGEGWDTNAFLKALELDFYDVLPETYKTDVAATREEAAQIIYNALTKNGKVSFAKVLEQYSEPSATKVLEVSCAAAQTITKVEYVPATTTAAAYIKATAGTYTFAVESFDAIGNVVDVYYKTGDATKVYFADVTTETAVVAKASALTAKDYTNYNASNIAVYTNYAANGTGAVADGNTVIYTVNATTGAKTIVAIQTAAVYSDETVTDNYHAATNTVAAYNHATLDLGTPVVIASGNVTAAGTAIGAYYFGDVAYTAATATETTKTTNVYYRTIGDQTNVKYYEINKVDYVTGTATRYNYTTSKVTVGGVEYALDGLTVIASGTPNATQILLGKSYSFRLNAAGALKAIEVAPAAETDYTGYKLGYVAGYPSTTVKVLDPTSGVVDVVTKTANIGFIDGTYGTYTVASVDGKKVVSHEAYVALTAEEKALVVDNNALSATGYAMVKVSGTSVDVLTTLKADAYVAAPAVSGAAKATLAKTTVAYASNIYVVNGTAFAYVANAGNAADHATAPFKMTFVKGAHDFNGDKVAPAGVDATYDAKYVTNYTTATQKTIAMFVIDAPYYVATSTAGTSYYYINKYLGQTAAGHEYEAYQVGATAPVTLTVTDLETVGKFYTVTTNTTASGTTYTLAGGKTAAEMSAVNLVFQGTTTAAYTLDGKVYFNAAATQYADTDIVVVDLRDTTAVGYKAVESIDKLPAGLKVIALYDTGSTDANKANIVSYMFIVDAIV